MIMFGYDVFGSPAGSFRSESVPTILVKIDTTTTTQADVENNTIRGIIYLQPTRTAEFVSLDFVITNAGAVV